VLGPLAELAPGLAHPVSGTPIGELWRRFDRGAHPLRETTLDGPDE
jgi:7,8-dihydro-6-hydroxymethylpterin-pyrophosphokinase